jgi:Domain of unknown function (DUF4411)
VRIWVIDTVSVNQIKRLIPRSVRAAVIAELDSRAKAGYIVYPPEVLDELERIEDLAFRWAKKHEPNGTRYGLLSDEAKAVLDRVPDLIDPEKISVDGIDDADPHVIALAVYIKNEPLEKHDVTIITEDFNSVPKKRGLADAAGLFGIPCVRFRSFVMDEKIWDGKEGT